MLLVELYERYGQLKTPTIPTQVHQILAAGFIVVCRFDLDKKFCEFSSI